MGRQEGVSCLWGGRSLVALDHMPERGDLFSKRGALGKEEVTFIRRKKNKEKYPQVSH